MASPALFDLTVAKLKVSKTINETAPGNFKHFYANPLFDRLVTPCLLYFLDKLQATTLNQVMLDHCWLWYSSRAPYGVSVSLQGFSTAMLMSLCLLYANASTYRFASTVLVTLPCCSQPLYSYHSLVLDLSNITNSRDQKVLCLNNFVLKSWGAHHFSPILTLDNRGLPTR